MKLANNNILATKYKEVMNMMRSAAYVYLPLMLIGGSNPVYAATDAVPPANEFL